LTPPTYPTYEGCSVHHGRRSAHTTNPREELVIKATTIATLLAALLMLHVTAPVAGAACPADSVQIGRICVDKYEASVWKIAPTNTTLNSSRRQHGLAQRVRVQPRRLRHGGEPGRVGGGLGAAACPGWDGFSNDPL
jgi:hypothetical protein